MLFHIRGGEPIAAVTSKVLVRVDRRDSNGPRQRVVELHSSQDGELRFRLWPEQVESFEYVTVAEIPTGTIVL